MVSVNKPRLGYEVPAQIGMAEADVETPALVINLDAFERNLRKMRDIAKAHGVALRAHAKAHKSAGVAHQQMKIGGAHGFCCQKVSEAEALVNEGIDDILISNQIVAPAKIDRLMQLAKRATLRVCVDDLRNVKDLSTSAQTHDVTLGCLVEIDVGAGRCGANPGAAAGRIASGIDAAQNLRFDGLQAYHGPAQHFPQAAKREAAFAEMLDKVKATIADIKTRGLDCAIISGAGTGTFEMEAASGIYTELQAGTYCFMDAAYMGVRTQDDQPAVPFENALFVASTIMSAARSGTVICDAGHKSHAVDSGLPLLFDADGARYVACNDEHGMIDDPKGVLDLHDRIRLIPGHCDPTCNLHDYLIGVRNGVVETVWPVTARGKLL
ncbi:DSD1 family PLP-dependent enzyme [Lentibacter algarum]|uniref:DSD1 family PLP-dependent enzyme n=1 Tax=Lentibacter algarum TaxID=576131 RepID=UPI001C06680A|nr:DSD1 family PLP-dependent enzyme [Lentibacter algarum]MBU2982015.1 DSD1 family PLP-dependent enzyme [Lentibacter algarum]